MPKNKKNLGRQRRQMSRRSRRANAPRAANGAQSIVSAPITTGFVGRQFSASFDRAPRSEEFPEGGLRVHFCQRSGGTIGVTDNVAYNAYAGGFSGFIVNPASPYLVDINGVDTQYSEVMLTSGQFIGDCATHHRFFAFRQLRLHYVPVIGTNTVGTTGYNTSLTFAWHADAMDLYDENGSTAGTIMSDRAVTTPNWQAVSVDLIPGQRLSQPPDTLYRTCGQSNILYVDTTAASISGVADLNVRSQGCVLIKHNLADSGATATFGYLWLEMIVDFYNMAAATSGVIPSAEDVARFRKATGQVKPAGVELKGEPVESKDKTRHVDTVSSLTSPKEEFELVPLDQLEKPVLTRQRAIATRAVVAASRAS